MAKSSPRPLDEEQRLEVQQAALLLARSLVDRTRSLYRELEYSTGAPVQAHRALALIADSPGIQSSHLAASLGMERSALSHLLRTLSEQGWIERRRESHDQRSVHLHVTRAGHDMVGATAGRMVGVLQNAVQQLDDSHLLELESALRALMQHIEIPAPVSVSSKRPRRPRVQRPA